MPPLTEPKTFLIFVSTIYVAPAALDCERDCLFIFCNFRADNVFNGTDNVSNMSTIEKIKAATTELDADDQVELFRWWVRRISSKRDSLPR
jgi:hypothetical protein